MWSPLGSSAMGSSTLRNSLSENSIPLLMYKSNNKKNRGPTVSICEVSEDEDERPLGKGRCVSMPSVVSTPVTPRHQQLLLLQLQQQNPGALQQGSHAKTSGSHHRRFLRRFPTVDNKEALVNHYSCALVADILLQGILYVGEHHFAFYSNILGYKKRLIIPVNEVSKVTKERTAKIIPNAVGIATAHEKYVFASLMSRDATYKAMHQVWSQCMDVRGSEEEDLEEEDDSSPSEVGVLPDSDTTNCLMTSSAPATLQAQDAVEGSHKGSASLSNSGVGRMETARAYICKLPRTSFLLLTSALLLVVLFASASVLVYRITAVQKQLTSGGPDIHLHPETPAHRWKTYQELSRRQNKALSEEVGRLTTRLQEHVKHLHQMRLPLEELAATASKLPDFCVSPPSTAKQQQQQQQTHRQQQEQPQSQWATIAAA